jgi:hypothetical protein
LLLLIALVHNICQIEIELPYVWQADVLWVEKGSEPRIVGRAYIECDLIVELANSDFVELLASQANSSEIAGALNLLRLGDANKLREDWLLTCSTMSVFMSTERLMKLSRDVILVWVASQIWEGCAARCLGR